MGEKNAIDKLNEQLEKSEGRYPPEKQPEPPKETILLSEGDQRYIKNESGAVSKDHLEARIRRLIDNLVQGDGAAALMETLLLMPHPDWKDDRREYSYPNREFMRVVGTSSCLVFAIQDGTGRFQIYWNSKPGTSPVFLVGEEDAFKLLISTSGTFTLFWADGSGKSAGDAISWVTLFDVSGGGSNDLYYDGVKKLETTSAGAKVTGDLEVTGDYKGSGKAYLPVGSLYVRFPGQTAPGSLFTGTWSEIGTSTWPGRFFRACGGAAAGFGTAQADAMRQLSGEVDFTSGGWEAVNAASGVFAPLTSFNGAPTGTSGYPNYKKFNMYASRQVSTTTEFRPINYAVEIYKRTA